MRTSYGHAPTLCALAASLCLVLCAHAAARAQARDADRIWTTVGSAGTVDETDVGKVFFDHGVVQMGHTLQPPPSAAKPRAAIALPTQSAVIRYNVEPVDGLFGVAPQPCTGTNCPALRLTLRYLDTGGAGAHVVARLIEIDMATGAERPLLTFDSNAPGLPASNHYQVQSGPPSCGPAFAFDFVRKAYYVEATLTSSAILGGVAAGIQAIKIEPTSCTG